MTKLDVVGTLANNHDMEPRNHRATIDPECFFYLSFSPQLCVCAATAASRFTYFRVGCVCTYPFPRNLFSQAENSAPIADNGSFRLHIGVFFSFLFFGLFTL